MVDTPILQLNDRWRIAHDGEVQWVLQERKGKASRKSSGWRGRSFNRRRHALERSIREHTDSVDPAALAIIAEWPERYSNFLTAWLAEQSSHSEPAVQGQDHMDPPADTAIKDTEAA